MEQPENQKMIYQPNALIDAKYSLNAHQNNIVLMGLGMLNTQIIHKQEDGIIFDIGELFKVTKTGLRKDRYIIAVKKAIQDLFSQQFSVHNPYTDDFQVHNWLSSMEGNFQSNKVTLYFNQRLLDLFNTRSTSGNFTKCFLKNVLPLKTSYAKRIYQIAMQYKPPIEIPEISIETFRQMLGVDKKYTSYKDLNKYVIKLAIADINKQTDIIIKMIPQRDGKTITSLKFKYKFKSSELQNSYNKKSVKKPTKKIFTKQVTSQNIRNLSKAQSDTLELMRTGGTKLK